MNNKWNSTTRVIVVTIFIIVIGLIVYSLRPLIGPMTVAALFAYTLYPVTRRLEVRTRIRHGFAVALVYFPFLIILIAMPSTLIPLLIRQIRTLSEEFTSVLNLLELRLAEPVTLLGRTISQEELANFINLSTEGLIPAASDAIEVLEATSTSLLWLVVILVTTYYLMLDWEGLQNWFINLLPESERSDLIRLMIEVDQTWRSYVRGTLALSTMMAIFFIVVGLAIGLPGAVALGLLTGLLSIIPELGPTIAGILSGVVAFFEGSSYLPLSNFWFAILIMSIYLVVMQVKSLWLRPLVMGRFMHLNTGLVFVAIIGSALIFGIFAALIILPVMATIGQVGNYVRLKLQNQSPFPDMPVTEMAPNPPLEE